MAEPSAEDLQKELDRIECDENQPRHRCLTALRIALDKREAAGIAAAIKALREPSMRRSVDEAIVEVLIELCGDKFPGQPRSFFELFAGHCTDAALRAAAAQLERELADKVGD